MAQACDLSSDLDDPLGTRRAQTDYAGVLEQSCVSLPFGDALSCAAQPGTTYSASLIAPTEQHFTGKERDAESGNDYFGARYYSSTMGRFLSPDWSAKVEPVPYAKLDDPQSLNLYSYVRNNPLGRVDVSGHSDYTLQKMKNWLERKGWKTDAQVKGLSISQTALNHHYSNDWEFLALNRSGADTGHPHDFKPGQNKCNEFAGDTVAESGKARPEITDKNGNVRMPSAPEWADPNVHIPGWSDTRPLSEARADDMLAQAHEDGGAHVGIVALVDGKLQTVSANAHYAGMITVNDWGFRPNNNGEGDNAPAPVVRHPE